MADERHAAWQAANSYLERTGQEGVLDGIADDGDIQAAKDLADRYRSGGGEYKASAAGGRGERLHAVTADINHEAFREIGGKRLAAALREAIEHEGGGPDGPAR